ncbi:MAG: glucose-6-phosphate dehydrogenase [Ilumatobacteraceae bacterium]
MPRTSTPHLPPAIFVLYGATGDLAKRMVLPAFFTLASRGLLPARWRLIGSGRGDVSHEDFAGHVRQSLSEFGTLPDAATWKALSSHLRFAGGDFTKGGHGALLAEIDDARHALGADAQLIHYMAIPPEGFGPLTISIGDQHLAAGSRVVYEKPFGTSQAAFRKLDRLVHRVFDESQVFRIDHFLGKEATQDLHTLRFANGLFAGMWGRASVRAVQIDCPETLGIADRADFYDHTGAFLDMVVTHLFQVAAEVAMEPPASLEPADLQAARELVLRRFRPLDPAEVVVGQYTGYRDVQGVAPRSRKETFFAARLWVDTPRWRGVPFLLRTGKRLHESHQSVSLILHRPEGPFANVPDAGNVVRFSLAGEGAIVLTMMAKRPGVGLELERATVTLPLGSLAGAQPLPPYSRLLHDVLNGDRSLVTRPDGLAHVWKVAQPILDLDRTPLAYAPGSWGPKAAQRLAAPDGWLLGQ